MPLPLCTHVEGSSVTPAAAVSTAVKLCDFRERPPDTHLTGQGRVGTERVPVLLGAGGWGELVRRWPLWGEFRVEGPAWAEA